MAMVHVDISNVVSWFYEVNSQEVYNLYTDFPVLLSPWSDAIYHFTLPARSNSEGKIIALPTRGMSFQVTIANMPLDTDEDRAAARAFMMASENCTDMLEPRWVQRCEIRMHGESRMLGGMSLVLDEQGAMVADSVPLTTGHPSLKTNENVRAFVYGAMYPVALAISLTHCRNVEVRDRPVSRQVRRMAERKGQPVIVYKELVIDAFRKQVRYETQGDGGNEIKRALHICRGHFATYGDHNPLFGKYTGTFWRPMHVRGHKEIGEVKKTYKVDSPR